MRIQTYNPSIGFNNFYVDSFGDYMKILDAYIKSHDYSSYDFRLNRMLAEVAPFTATFDNEIRRQFDDLKLHSKFEITYANLRLAMISELKNAFNERHIRRLIFFDLDRDPVTFSCISMLQFVLNENGWNLMVYQRASDLIKLVDDMNFLCHAIHLFESSFNVVVNTLTVNYGTIHLEIK